MRHLTDIFGYHPPIESVKVWTVRMLVNIAEVSTRSTISKEICVTIASTRCCWLAGRGGYKLPVIRVFIFAGVLVNIAPSTTGPIRTFSAIIQKIWNSIAGAP